MAPRPDRGYDAPMPPALPKEPTEDPFVAVVGSIGAGKSGLVERLARTLGAAALSEDVDGNPYFDRFYDDPARWAFHSQVAFAADALARHAASLGGGPAVQDRTAYEAVDVFGRLLLEIGHLSSEQFSVLGRLGDCARRLPRQPTLLIHLHAPVPVLLRRIAGAHVQFRLPLFEHGPFRSLVNYRTRDRAQAW